MEFGFRFPVLGPSEDVLTHMKTTIERFVQFTTDADFSAGHVERWIFNKADLNNGVVESNWTVTISTLD